MKSPTAAQLVGFFLFLGAGFWMGRQMFAARTNGSVEKESAMPGQSTAVVAPSASGKTSAKSTSKPSPLTDRISFLQKLQTMPPEQFPELFERVLEGPASNENLFALMTTWQDRDLDGYIQWLRNQPPYRKPSGFEMHFDIRSELLKKLSKTAPDRAWKLVGELPGSRAYDRWNVVNGLLKADANAAVSFVRSHRDFLEATPGANTGFTDIDPIKVLPVLKELPPGDTRTDALQTLAMHYAGLPAEEASAKTWYGSLPDEMKSDLLKVLDKTSAANKSNAQLSRLREMWKPPVGSSAN